MSAASPEPAAPSAPPAALPEPPLPAADSRRTELRDFLRTRRARVRPSDAGMPEAGRRRTPGLRREEVAALAGVGVSWYTRLEQGRAINVSGEVLDAVARTLRLGPDEREHLYLLAGLNPPVRRDGGAGELPGPLLRVLDGWEPRPAYVRDRYWNVAAANAAAAEVLGYGRDDRNCLVAFFTAGRFRSGTAAWAAAARGVVARFRGDAARYPDDPGFAAIARRLAARSPEFAALWSRHEVDTATHAVKSVAHPELGELSFESTLLALPDLPGYALVLFNPVPGTPTEERLARALRGAAQEARENGGAAAGSPVHPVGAAPP